MSLNAVHEAKLIKIKISQLIKFSESFRGIELHVLVGGKFVKMNYANEQFIEILRRLQQKDLEEVYVNQMDCSKIVNSVQEKMSNKSFYDPKTTDEERIERSYQSAEIAKNFINQLGPDKTTIDIMKTVGKKTTEMMHESPSLFSFIERFRKNCSDEFMKTILTGYLMSMVIDKFPWKTSQVKEKAALASMLCDLTLDKNDFKAIRETQQSTYSEKIMNHPLDVATLLNSSKDLIPQETITMILQHHEKPDGTGFPYGIGPERFNQMSAIFIVCQVYTEKLFINNFDYSKRLYILSEIKASYRSRSFEKAIIALSEVVS